MTRFPMTSIQGVCLMLAGLLWATIPDAPIPGLEWRLHFGGAQFIFGTMFGIGVGLMLSRVERPQGS